jgi:hypothetical protein
MSGLSKLRALTLEECTICVHAEPEDTHPEGQFASGDDEADREFVASALRRLESGDTWAWAWVRVRVSWNGFTGEDSLGCCSYESEEDFREAGDYYEGMAQTALENLNQTLAELHAKLATLVVTP